jgi:hypothetical protein
MPAAMPDEQLMQYEGPVVNLGDPGARHSAIRWYCDKCSMEPVSFAQAITAVAMPSVVVLQPTKWRGIQADGGDLWLWVFTGQCPDCGTVYQTWRHIIQP